MVCEHVMGDPKSGWALHFAAQRSSPQRFTRSANLCFLFCRFSALPHLRFDHARWAVRLRDLDGHVVIPAAWIYEGLGVVVYDM